MIQIFTFTVMNGKDWMHVSIDLKPMSVAMCSRHHRKSFYRKTNKQEHTAVYDSSAC